MERISGSPLILALVTVALTGCGANYSKTVASTVTTGTSTGTSSSSGSGTTAVLPAPVFSIAGGSFTSAQDVTLSSPVSGAAIYYTIDGTTPTTASPVYTAAVHVAQTMTIEAMATGVTGYTQSAVAMQTYTISSATPVIATTVVNQSLPGVTIPTTFLGYSHSWDAVAHILGDSTTTTNYIYRQLTSNLSTLMGGPLVVRVGGEPTAQATEETVRPMTELAAASGVKLLLSVNLEASDLALAQQQAETYLAYVPAASLQGIEIGNEPDGYVLAGYRPAGYAYTDFFPQYQQWVNGLAAVSNATAPIAGPVFSSIQWIPNATTDVANTTMQAAVVTQHHYIACYYADAPLATNVLLQPSSTSGVLPYFKPYVVAAHAAGAPFRVAELNSICLGGQPGVSNSFSSALWGVDMMFSFASIGVDGVNWHTDSDGGVYDLYHFFTFKNQYYLENVNPVFYGLQFFAGAAGNGAQLLQASTATSSNIKVWVTKNSNTGHAHLVIINKEISTAGNVQVTMPGYTTGVLTTLTGANYLATSGITIGGQTYDGSPDGTLQGTPVSQTITPVNGVWTVPVQAMSAVSVDLQN